MLRLGAYRALGSVRRRAVETCPRHERAPVERYGEFMALSSASADAHLQEPPPSSPVSSLDVETILAYHGRTKHTSETYAETSAKVDMASQPSPFRKYLGVPRPIPLRHMPPVEHNPPDQQYAVAFTEFFNPVILTKAAISQLLYDSFANSIWQQAGDQTWALRVTPSCGNIHPIEAYVICSNLLGISDKPFIAHYSVKDHAFEMRATIPVHFWMEMKKDLPQDVFFIAITSIDWRQAWKYGERGFRYVNQDIGHALGALSIAGAAQGWDSQIVEGWGNTDLNVLLGLPEHKEISSSMPKQGQYPELEQERSVCLVAFHAGRKKVSLDSNCRATELVRISNVIFPHQSLLDGMQSIMQTLSWNGHPNVLSTEHTYYNWIERAILASLKPASPLEVSTKSLPQYWCYTHHYKRCTVRQVIHKRRSAVNLDGQHMLKREAFYQMMWKLSPSGFNVQEQGESHQFPFRILPWQAEVHLAFMVHRIDNLPKGLYILVRNYKHEEELRQALKPEFQWKRLDKCPDYMPLYKLADADMEKLAKQTACFQDIAGDGCFTTIMLARFNAVNEKGAWMYPRLYWECGVLGQLLSLEAHAMGLSACGIGYFFDDAVHKILGIEGKEFQCLYLFSVGAAVDDKNITCLPAYPSPDSIKKV